jgi:hypothetical protein
MRQKLILLLLLLPAMASAQRVIGDLESNTDKSMIQEDSVDDKKKENKIVPVDVRAWTIDEVYGNRSVATVDTMQHLFQNTNLAEGIRGHYNHLGNLGSPRLNRIFMERNDNDEFIFLRPFDQFYVPADKFLFYNTRSPYLNATYNCVGSKETGDDHVKVVYTQNAGKRINFGGLYDYMYGQGYYANQSTSYMGASGWASYLGDKYEFKFYYTHNFMKMAENGGITDEAYITDKESMSSNVKSNDIPTYLSNTWSRQEHDIIHFNHRYNIGFYRETGDTTNIQEEFVPVTSLFHTVSMRYLRRNYRTYTTPDNYHTYTYLDGDTTNDRTKDLVVKNIVGISLREGFNKYAAAGINAYVEFEHQSFEMPDTFVTTLTQSVRYLNKNKVKENNISIGGQLLRTQGKQLHFNINAHLTLTGERSGDFYVDGRGELNVPVLGDTAQLVVNASVRNQLPSYYIRHYHSTHAWWDYDFDKENRTRIQGQLTIPHTKTTITVGAENIKNYTYFANTGLAYTDGSATRYSNNVTPMQHSGSIQVLSANLSQQIKLGILHIELDATYQKTGNKQVLPLPTLSLFANAYIKFRIAKVLGCELGADMKYFTEYYAPDYSPVVSQFMIQNQQNLVKIGNYPLVSAYANFDLKRTRFYVQYYHANQSDGRYFWAPGYPINPSCIRFGLSWNFYD